MCGGVEWGGDGVVGGGTKEERALDRDPLPRQPGRAHGSASERPSSPPGRLHRASPCGHSVNDLWVVVHRARDREVGGHGHGGGSVPVVVPTRRSRRCPAPGS